MMMTVCCSVSTSQWFPCASDILEARMLFLSSQLKSVSDCNNLHADRLSIVV